MSESSSTPAMIAVKAFMSSPDVQSAAKKEAKLKFGVMANDWKFWFLIAVTFAVGYVLFVMMRPLIYLAIAGSFAIGSVLYLKEWCKNRRAKVKQEEGEKQSLVE
eukprot:c10108_g1_i2.p1 GENE.c10108_g1_i2~~c10108_g1_i2.p1  ORF type:complete len:105 (-),score=25.33 c10108_g1_i2:250-564(-)